MIKNKRIFKTLEQIKPVITKRGAELKKAYELSLSLEEQMEKTLSSTLKNLPSSLTPKDINKEAFYWLISYEFNFSNNTICFNSERTYSIFEVDEATIQTEMGHFLEKINERLKFIENSKKEYQCDDQLTLVLLKAVHENPNQTVFDYIDYLKGIGSNTKNLADFGVLEAYNELFLFVKYERLLQDAYLTFRSKQQRLYNQIIEDEELFPFDPFGDYSFLFPHPLQSFDDATLSLAYRGEMTLESSPAPTTEKFRDLMSPTGIINFIQERDLTTFEKLTSALPLELSSFVFLEILKKLSPLTENDVQLLINFIKQDYPFYQSFQKEFVETISTLIPPIYQDLFELNALLTTDDTQEVFRLISEELTKLHKE